MILQTFLVRLLSPYHKSKRYANSAGVGKRAWSGGGSGARRVPVCGTCLILRGRSLIVRENVQTESPSSLGKGKRADTP